MFENIASHTIYSPGLPGRPVVLDLGAHRAEFAREMRTRYGATCHLVEANPVLADALRHEGWSSVLERAVADYDGLIAFNIAKNDTGSSILPLAVANEWNLVLAETRQVRASTIESLITDVGAQRIDLLKMDIEGAEVAALRTISSSALRSVGQITVEFHSAPIFGFGLEREVEEVVDLMRRHDFVCLDFSGGSRLDVLFINRTVHEIGWGQAKFWEIRQSPPRWLLSTWATLPRSVRDVARRALDAITASRSGL